MILSIILLVLGIIVLTVGLCSDCYSIMDMIFKRLSIFGGIVATLTGVICIIITCVT